MNKESNSSTIPEKAFSICVPRQIRKTEAMENPAPIIKTKPSPNSDNRIDEKVVTFLPDIVKIADLPIQVMKNIDTSELIEHYRLECIKYKIKPIDKLITQLEKQTTIPRVIQKLDISDAKLDLPTIESLEIIFMNLTIEHFSVRNCNLDDDTCTVLCEILSYYDCVYHLDIGSNIHIGVKGWSSLTDYFSHSFIIEALDLSRTVFTDQIMNFVATGIANSFSLKIIMLENCCINGERLKIMADRFNKKCILEELYLAENKIGPKDCDKLGNILRSCRSLKILDLENNPILDNGLIVLCEFFTHFRIINIECLHLWNTGITFVSMPKLASFLSSEEQEHKINLKLLNIGKNKIGDDGIIALKASLALNRSLKRLGLASVKLTSIGIIAIAEIIAVNKSIIRVDLRDNNVNAAGVLALSQALRHNNTMIRINLNTDFPINEFTEIELNRVLDEIKEICDKNLENTKLISGSDEISMLSSLSSDQFPLFQNPDSSTFNQIKNFVHSPWKYTKSKILNALYKEDIELNAEVPTPLALIAEENNKKSPFRSHTDIRPNSLEINQDGSDRSITPKSDQTPFKDDYQKVGNRFFVKPVNSAPSKHRRCFSESLTGPVVEKGDSYSKTVIKVTKQQNIPTINIIPCEEGLIVSDTNRRSLPILSKSSPVIADRVRRASFNSETKNASPEPET